MGVDVTTKGGDKGESGLFTGERLWKDDIIFEALGDLDELHVALAKNNLHECIDLVQRVSAMIATSQDTWQREQYVKDIDDTDVSSVESMKAELDRYVIIPESLAPYNQNATSASLASHEARAICRRCERRIVTLIRDRERFDLIDAQRLLNRMADYLFVYAYSVSLWSKRI